ncbi:MAG: TM2 domain-containing protein [Clostridium sulfidigenes]|uniref:TM2 domain-containing protein n=2 Tax=Clostridium sulfidigenes TaxID=318464 RepID=A0A927ZJB7_9CLOT|nr:TM2 domain-containing protein [Clostridium sulfidigenes]
MNERQCPTCGAAIDLNATECKYCGEPIAVQQPQPQQQYQQPQYQQQQYQQTQYQQPMYAQPPVPSKSKIAAGILAILLGGLGIHKFYLGKIGMGILYILFCWTYIPAIIGVVEGIIYLTASDEKFYYKYDKH